MSVIEIFLIGVGLAMDAFAVSVCKGLGMTKINLKQGLLLAFFFGGFQALMPLLGYYLGGLFYEYISQYGSWISFALLAFIGGKMSIDGIKERNDVDSQEMDPKIGLVEVLILAIATSIDAFAVGVTFSLLAVNIIVAILIIGIVTFAISFAGVVIGNMVGARFSTPAKILGGVILVLMGLRILLVA